VVHQATEAMRLLDNYQGLIKSVPYEDRAADPARQIGQTICAKKHFHDLVED